MDEYQPLAVGRLRHMAAVRSITAGWSTAHAAFIGWSDAAFTEWDARRAPQLAAAFTEQTVARHARGVAR